MRLDPVTETFLGRLAGTSWLLAVLGVLFIIGGVVTLGWVVVGSARSSGQARGV